MAFTDLGSLASGGSRTANQSTFSVFTTAAVAAGELIVAVTSVDVAGLSSGIDASTYDLRIGGTNGDRFATYGDRRSNQPGTGSQTGVASTLWWMIAPQAYASGTEIIAKFNSPTESDHAAIIARHFSLSAGNCAIIDTGAGIGWTSNVVTTAAGPSSLNVTTTNVGCLRVRSLAAKWPPGSFGNTSTGAPFTGWTPVAQSGPFASSPDWEVSAWAESAITTNTSVVSSPGSPGTSASAQTSVYVALKEVPIITGTLAAVEGADTANFSPLIIYDLGQLAYGGVEGSALSGVNFPTIVDAAAGELVVVVIATPSQGTTGPELLAAPEPRNLSTVTVGGQAMTLAGTVPSGNYTSPPQTQCFIYWRVLTSAVSAGTNISLSFPPGGAADPPNSVALTARHFVFSGAGIEQLPFTGSSTIVGGSSSDPPSLDLTTANLPLLRVRGTSMVLIANSTAGGATSGWTGWVQGTTYAPSPPDVLKHQYARGEHIVFTGTSKVSDPTWTGGLNANVYASFHAIDPRGTLAATETGSDSAGFPGAVDPRTGTIEAYEGAVWMTADSTLFTADDNVRQVNTAIITRDVAAFAGQVLTGPIGVIAATETTTDTAAFTGILGVIGTLAVTEGLSASGPNLINHETWTPTYVTLSGTGSIGVTETVDNNAHRIAQIPVGGKASGEFRFSFDYLGVGPAARGVSLALGSSVDSLTVELGPNGTLLRSLANGLAVIRKITITSTTGGLWNVEIYFRAVATFGSLELYLFNVSGGDGYVFPGSGNGILFRGSSLTRAEVDTAAFVGGTGLVGTLAVTDGASTAAFSGTVVWPVITGVVAATEAPDVVAFTGFAQASGTLVATEENDTAAFVGGPVVAGVLAASEVGSDASNFIGFVTNQGTYAAVEDSDTVALTASVAWAATLAVTEAVSDSAAFNVMAAERGSASATEGADVVFFDGWLSKLDEKVGQLQANEDRIAGIYAEPRADSTLVTADNDLYHASIDYYGMDRASFAGGISVTAFLVAREVGQDIPAFRVNVPLGGALAATEVGDEAGFTGTTQTLIRMVLAAQEGRDTALFSEPPLERTGVLAAVEAADIALFTIPTWEQVGEGAGLKNELQRMLWLEGQGGRVTWLEGEVEDTSWLKNLEPEMVSLVAEQARITELRP